MSKIKLSKIKPNPNNPRIIKDDKFKKLVQSLQEFPEMMEKRPMVCVTDVDGSIYPLGGNMRLKALQELKFKEIPSTYVMMADEWTEERRREFVIKDNIGYGEWEWEQLANDWDTEQLQDWGLEVLGFADSVDYSDKNEEIDIDALDTEMIIKLKYTEDEYQLVREQLSKIAATPEQAVWKLLGNE
jgi:ParB-like chromosome segregation protein Spo0J